jgi:hypothetical protein
VNACREEKEGQAGVTLVKGTGTISGFAGLENRFGSGFFEPWL